jgi:hypothetical protein
MSRSNTQILSDVRDTMKLMLISAESHDWQNVTNLDQERNKLLADLSKTEYTGDLQLIDEIVKLDQKIVASAIQARAEISEKVSVATHTREVHEEYKSIAKL